MTARTTAVGTADASCGWVASCESPALHRVERQTRPGLILREAVCDEHVDVARRRGYLLRKPAAAPSADGRGSADG